MARLCGGWRRHCPPSRGATSSPPGGSRAIGLARRQARDGIRAQARQDQGGSQGAHLALFGPPPAGRLPHPCRGGSCASPEDAAVMSPGHDHALCIASGGANRGARELSRASTPPPPRLRRRPVASSALGYNCNRDGRPIESLIVVRTEGGEPSRSFPFSGFWLGLRPQPDGLVDLPVLKVRLRVRRIADPSERLLGLGIGIIPKTRRPGRARYIHVTGWLHSPRCRPCM